MGDEFIHNIMINLGRYVYVDTPTAKTQRLDVARILVATTSPDFINQVMKIRINGIVFSIKLVEDPYTNPYVHIGDVYKAGVRSKNYQSSLSDDNVEK